MLSTNTSKSTYVPSGLSPSPSTSTEIRYQSTTNTSTKYSGPNPAPVYRGDLMTLLIFMQPISSLNITVTSRCNIVSSV